MLMLVAPRNARDMDLDTLQEAADAGHLLVASAERERLRDALLEADPGLVVLSEEDERIVLAARGRSGLTIRLGTVWHEVELPDWHEGAAGTWLADRFVALLRIFPRISGGSVLDGEEGHALDPTQQAGLVERYRYRVQAGPDAPMLPTLDVVEGDADAFSDLAEPVLRRRGASAADRAWFFAQAAQHSLDRDLSPDDPVEVRYDPAMRLVQVVRYADDGEATPVPATLADAVRDTPPELPDNLTARDQDPAAVDYLANLLSWDQNQD